MPTVVNNTQVVLLLLLLFWTEGDIPSHIRLHSKLKCTWHKAKLVIPVRNRRSVYIESSVVTHAYMVGSSTRAHEHIHRNSFQSIHSVFCEFEKIKKNYANTLICMAWHGSICKEKKNMIHSVYADCLVLQKKYIIKFIV